MKNSISPHVLLVHGLAETSWMMKSLEGSLRREGFETSCLDYPSTSDTVENLSERYLLGALDKLADIETLHIVTHSMGGIMLRYLLEEMQFINISRIVMLAPAHKGSRTITIQMKNPLLKAILGPAGQQSADDKNCFACRLKKPISKKTGIIAGCVSLDPLGSMVLPWPHDGKTTVEGTKIPGMTDHMVLPTTHDMIMFDPAAIYQTCYFFKNGIFDH